MVNENLLGVEVDNLLSWKEQIKKVKRTINFKISLLRRIRKYLSTDTCKTFYNLHIQPHLEYCCSVWGRCSQEKQDKLIKLQRHAARLVLNCPRLTSSRLMFSHLHWLRFDKLVHLKQVTLMYKSLNNLASGYMSQMFLKSKGIRSSSENKVYVPCVHKNSL